MSESQPDDYLLDHLIDYAEDQKLSLEEAALLVAKYAQQRVPEYRLERKTRTNRNKIRDEIAQSPRESLIIRVLVRSRIHEIAWTYYPKYHVVGSPRETNWYSIRYKMPVWKSFAKKTEHYLDNLYYDKGWEQFWMTEPYLSDLPVSAALFSHLSEKKSPVIEGTTYRKVDPKLIADFLKLRKATPVFTKREVGDDFELSRRKPYGSAGWQKRITLVDSYLRRRK